MAEPRRHPEPSDAGGAASSSPPLPRAAAAWALRLFRLVAFAFAALCIASPATWRSGMDFSWRYNEALCVRSGVDPYEICFGAAESPRFCSVFAPEPGKLPVNAYSPWEYTWMLPFTALPREVAHMGFALLNLAALAGIVALVRRRARAGGLDSARAWTVAAAACFLGLSLYRVLQVSNYGLLMAFAATALAAVLGAGHPPSPAPRGRIGREMLAGLCWAALLVKPQIGVLFAIPLALGRHAIALASGAGFCALSTLPAAALCHADPATMVWRVLHSGTQSIRSTELLGSPLLPPEIVSALSRVASPHVWLAASAALGLAACALLSWKFRRHADPVARLAPAVVVGLLWMPGHFHDRVILAPVLAWLMIHVLSRRNRTALAAWFLFTAEFWACLVLAAALCPAFAAAWHAGKPVQGVLQGLTARIDDPALRSAYDLWLFAAGWLQIAVLGLLARRDSGAISPSSIPPLRSVLVYAPNWLGDAIMAMPALQVWRDRHPDALLAILTKRSNAELWRMHPAADEVVVLEPGTRGTFRTGRRLRGRRFDAAYLLPNSFRSALVAWLAGIPRRRGVGRHARSLLLTERARLSTAREDYHQSRETAPILLGDAFTPRTPLPQPRLGIPETLRAETLGSFGVGDAPDGLVGVIPGAARGDSKRWPHFADAARRLTAGHPGRRFVVLGTAAESALCREVAEAVGEAAVSVAGKTTMPQFAALLAACSVVLCNDSGGMHLATAVGTPVVAVFGLTDWRRTGPLGPLSVVVRQDGAQGRRAIARHSAAAAAVLRSIPPERVAAAAEWLLRQPR